MYHFQMQCFLKELFCAARSFKLFESHMLNIFLTTFSIFLAKLGCHDLGEGGFKTKKRLQNSVFWTKNYYDIKST